MANVSVDWIKKQKNVSKVTMLTVYDALFAGLFDGIAEILLIGDSLNMSFNGKNDTLSVTIDEMIYHAKAVCMGAKHSLIVLDMPFGSYHTKDDALKNGTRVLKETSVQAIKLEGGEAKAEVIDTLVSSGIAVMGHIGLLPQQVRAEGGYKIKGKESTDIQQLKNDVRALEDAGVFSIVVEGVKADTARELSAISRVPLIGIGSGCDVDGQVLVFSDMLGLNTGHYPKFVRKYLEGASLIQGALKKYVEDVKSGNFPNKDESY